MWHQFPTEILTDWESKPLEHCHTEERVLCCMGWILELLSLFLTSQELSLPDQKAQGIMYLKLLWSWWMDNSGTRDTAQKAEGERERVSNKITKGQRKVGLRE